jgi:hypothetical protein
MFAVIYRGYIKPNHETKYQDSWQKIATYFVEQRGALGSCLHKTEEGMWVAYSRWPNKKTRDAAWPGENAPAAELPDDIKQAIIELRSCLDQERQLPEICMHVVNDLLLK